MSGGFIRVRIDDLEFRNAEGATEIEVAAVEEPLAAIVRIPLDDTTRYAEKIVWLRAEHLDFPIAADFFRISEEEQGRELLRAVTAVLPHAPNVPPELLDTLPLTDSGLRLTRILHRTGGPFLILLNTAGQYGSIDDIEIAYLREFLHEPLSGRPPIAPLLGDEIWDRNLMEPAIPLRLASREGRWALEIEGGQLFANLDDRDISAIRRARGW